ncbi:MAG TPA: hypothetical protein VGJ95_06170 [Pseudonocardiaceae bacterium]
MNAWAKRGLQAALFTGGMLALGAGIASANECCPDRPTSPLAPSLSVPGMCDNVIGAPAGQLSTPCLDQTLNTDNLLATADQLLPTTGPAAVPARAGAIDHVLAAGDVISNGALTQGSGNIVAAAVAGPAAFAGNAISWFGTSEAEHPGTVASAAGGRHSIAGDGTVGAGQVVSVPVTGPGQITGNGITWTARTSTDSSTFTQATAGGLSETDGSLGNGMSWIGRAAAAHRTTVAAQAGGNAYARADVSLLGGVLASTPVAAPVDVLGDAAFWFGMSAEASLLGFADASASSTISATAGGSAGTAGTGATLAGNVELVAAVSAARPFGIGRALLARASAAADTESVIASDRQVVTDGTGASLAGNIASLPVGALESVTSAVSGVTGLAALPVDIDVASAIETDVESILTTGLDGFGLPAVGSLPAIPDLPELPDLDLGALVTVDGLAGVVASVDVGLLADVDALVTVDGGVTAAVAAVAELDSSALAGLGTVPSLDVLGELTVDVLASVDALLVVDGAGPVDSLPPLPEVADVADVADLADLVDLANVADLADADAVLAPLPLEPLELPELPELGALPLGDQPALVTLGGLDLMRDLTTGLAGLVGTATELPNA